MAINTSYSPEGHAVNMNATVDGLGALTLFVEDLHTVRAFYSGALQLREVFRDDVSTVFQLGGTMLNVLEVGAASEVVAPAQPAAARETPSILLSLWVEDVDAVCQELQERGVLLLNGPIDRPWGKRTAAFMDPAGIAWEIAQSIA